jgi:hypothetical protein
MYLVEHYTKTLKGCVKNKARLEGSITKSYAIKEVVGIYTKYLQEFTFTKRRVWDDKEYPSMFYEMLEGIGSTQIMNVDLQDMSHSFCFKMWS